MNDYTKQDIENKIREIVSEQITLDPDANITEDTRLIEDLGVDSLDSVNILLSLEEQFDLDISDEDAGKLLSMKEAVDYILKATSQKEQGGS